MLAVSPNLLGGSASWSSPDAAYKVNNKEYNRQNEEHVEKCGRHMEHNKCP
jgi:hypothetical protein